MTSTKVCRGSRATSEDFPSVRSLRFPPTISVVRLPNDRLVNYGYLFISRKLKAWRMHRAYSIDLARRLFHSLGNSRIMLVACRSIRQWLNEREKRHNLNGIAESLDLATNKLIYSVFVWSSRQYVWNSIRALIGLPCVPMKNLQHRLFDWTNAFRILAKINTNSL